MKSPLTSFIPALGLLLALGSCARPEEVQPPPKLLTKQQMVSLLIRFHLLEARLESGRFSPDSSRAQFLSMQRDILWHYGIAEEDSSFQRSYYYYASHKKDLDDIYAAVIDSLDAQQKRMGGQPTVKHP
ncbi:DUF4296 domain-containing protein [Hymenobacter sp. BRD67]|uniref:DUF4296 domain-containing protein n=1 Tax=Hymenobacter sp. BRD67 TaxID=2675877 RepID=UPI0015669475|nr:DUF4296 domain-containing protein [Hymenobacter sp. BRD67]QKG52075.1 DUF4296 domain-containing protein [Hymenobacter sp. BRD67]